MHGPILLWLAVALVGVYGGYFGAAQGVLLIAILGIGLSESLLKINAIKNTATIVNAIASVVFVIVSEVNWPGSDRDRRRIGARRPSWWQGRPQAARDRLSGDHCRCRHHRDCQFAELSVNGKTSAYGRPATDRPDMAILLRGSRCRQ